MPLITNIEQKMIEKKFTQFIDGQLVSGDTVIDFIADPGVGGVTMIPVIAYASAIDGTGFTLTNSDTLEYTATAVLDATVTPVIGDFAGKWYHRKGLPGATPDPVPGADGDQAGFNIIYLSDTTAQKPTTAGGVAFNNADLSLATAIYLDELLPNGVDLSGVINQFTAGMMFSIGLNVTSSNTLAVFELTDVPVDNGDWFSIPVINRAKSSANFANLDQCTFQIFGGSAGGATVDEAAVLAAGNFIRAADNGAGGYKFVDNANVEIKSASNVFKLPAFTITGVSNLPAANTFPHGTVVRLHQDCLVGAGSNPMGVEIWADSVNNIWRPHGPQTLFWNDYGLLASPTVSLTAAGKFDLGGVGDPIIPAGLLNVGSRVRFFARLHKVGATAPVLRMYFGTDLTTRTNNSQIWAQTATTTTDLDIPPETLLTFISATTARSSNRATRGGSGAQGTVTDATTLLQIASAMKATIEASTLASDTVNLLSFGIVWEG